jgi:catechol 2,3-dioxygenase-like lactoylglutathione lyase family enzyme
MMPFSTLAAYLGTAAVQEQVVGITPILPVPDVAAAVEYYRDKLGFEVVFQVAPEGVGPYACVRRGGYDVHFIGGDPPETPGARAGLYLQVRDVGAFYAEMKDRGAFGPGVPRVFTAIREHPVEEKNYGRDTIFVDLNGYTICAGQPYE